MRRHYIDNLRTFCILLLFPYHTSMIYNNFGESFYVTASPEYLPSLFGVIVYPWWMTLLFVLAGMSSYYALEKKSVKAYASERIHKLLVPFIAGLVLLIPVQSYIADIFHNQYAGSYIEHLKIFFTRFTDLIGTDGGFTPAHLWFVLYLFVISLVLLPFMNHYMKSKKLPVEKANIVVLILLFIIVLVCTPILDFGKSVGESLACFALGFYVLSNDKVQEKLQKNRLLLAVLFGCLMAVRVLLWNRGVINGLFADIQYRIYLWIGILFFIGFAKTYWNKTNKVLIYFSNASFSLFFFHQSILIVIGYYVIKALHTTWLQFLIIMTGTFILSLGCYEVCRRFRILSYLFGIKQNRSSKTKEC